MNTNNLQNYKYKTVYSIRIRQKLREAGFEPLAELDNPYKEGLKCWKYLATPNFEEVFSSIILEKGGTRNGKN